MQPYEIIALFLNGTNMPTDTTTCREEAARLLQTLAVLGYIVVKNTEPSEFGFSCHVCGCEYLPR